jgi:hypothetical protein
MDSVATNTTTAIHARAPGTAVRTLERMVDSSDAIDGLRSDDVNPGDFVVVHTKNSVYSMAVVGDGRFRVTGGWFRSEGSEGTEIGVAGCTWGGAAIHTRIIAAAGMYLEFDNGVRTTRIRQVRVIRGESGRTH